MALRSSILDGRDAHKGRPAPSRGRHPPRGRGIPLPTSPDGGRESPCPRLRRRRATLPAGRTTRRSTAPIPGLRRSWPLRSPGRPAQRSRIAGLGIIARPGPYRREPAARAIRPRATNSRPAAFRWDLLSAPLLVQPPAQGAHCVYWPVGLVSAALFAGVAIRRPVHSKGAVGTVFSGKGRNTDGAPARSRFHQFSGAPAAGRPRVLHRPSGPARQPAR
jgi:hypothetical protein